MFSAVWADVSAMRIALALTLLTFALPAAHAQDAETIEDEWVDAAPQPRSEALLRTEMLRDHNRVRAHYALPALVWDAQLAADALDYANELAARNRFEHAPRLPGRPVQGENLWMGTRSAYAYREMTGSWIEEGADFRNGAFPDVSRTGSWHDVGHFTQIIWGETRAVGCGLAANRENEYLVCRYFPAGNVWGERTTDQRSATDRGSVIPSRP